MCIFYLSSGDICLGRNLQNEIEFINLGCLLLLFLIFAIFVTGFILFIYFYRTRDNPRESGGFDEKSWRRRYSEIEGGGGGLGGLVDDSREREKGKGEWEGGEQGEKEEEKVGKKNNNL